MLGGFCIYKNKLVRSLKGGITVDVNTINPKVGHRKIGDFYTLYHCGTQELQTLNETGSLIWACLLEGLSTEAIGQRISASHNVSVTEATEDAEIFIEDLRREGYLGNKVPAPDGVDNYESGGYDALLDLELRAIEGLVPFAATFEVTYSCNEKCVHCYMDRTGSRLSLTKIKDILDQLAEAGCLFVSFTGGELFTRGDALEIIHHASSKNFVIDVLSNGTLIDEGVCRALESCSVRRVQVSIYGSNEVCHDRITQLPGSLTKTTTAIRLLRNHGIKVEVAFPMMQGNFDQRYDVRELAISMGCEFSPSPYITARNDGSQDTFAMRITDEQLRQFLSDPELAMNYAGRKPFEEHQFYFGFSDLRDAPPCYSGFNSVAINPDGIVLPCNQFLLPLGDLKETGFRQIWSSEPAEMLREVRIGNLEVCPSCTSLAQCTRCPGLAMLEGGSMLGPSPENCRVVKISQTIEEGR